MTTHEAERIKKHYGNCDLIATASRPTAPGAGPALTDEQLANVIKSDMDARGGGYQSAMKTARTAIISAVERAFLQEGMAYQTDKASDASERQR